MLLYNQLLQWYISLDNRYDKSSQSTCTSVTYVDLHTYVVYVRYYRALPISQSELDSRS